MLVLPVPVLLLAVVVSPPPVALPLWLLLPMCGVVADARCMPCDARRSVRGAACACVLVCTGVRRCAPFFGVWCAVLGPPRLPGVAPVPAGAPVLGIRDCPPVPAGAQVPGRGFCLCLPCVFLRLVVLSLYFLLFMFGVYARIILRIVF